MPHTVRHGLRQPSNRKCISSFSTFNSALLLVRLHFLLPLQTLLLSANSFRVHLCPSCHCFSKGTSSYELYRLYLSTALQGSVLISLFLTLSKFRTRYQFPGEAMGPSLVHRVYRVAYGQPRWSTSPWLASAKKKHIHRWLCGGSLICKSLVKKTCLGWPPFPCKSRMDLMAQLTQL
jgi:hypothetical protein